MPSAEKPLQIPQRTTKRRGCECIEIGAKKHIEALKSGTARTLEIRICGDAAT